MPYQQRCRGSSSAAPFGEGAPPGRPSTLAGSPASLEATATAVPRASLGAGARSGPDGGGAVGVVAVKPAVKPTPVYPLGYPSGVKMARGSPVKPTVKVAAKVKGPRVSAGRAQTPVAGKGKTARVSAGKAKTARVSAARPAPRPG